MPVGQRFAEFFAEVNAGRPPYPWQQALVEQVAASGRWPDIAAPTGAGKSSVIDAHVFLVAEHAAGRLPVRPPRRLVLVAPRRVLVDDQYDRARALADSLGDAGPRSAEAAAALRGLFTSEAEEDEPPALAAWRLRGGVLPDTGWRLEPAACQVICTTPQMWGSRLLLRGYGATRASRNLEAGLLGQDVVAVIDEAHLHERLLDTARNVAARSPASMGLQVVAMSATRPPDEDQLGLTSTDFADAELARRVRASKTIEVVEVANWRRDAARAVVDRARFATGQGTVGVFVNDVPMALDVAAALGDDGSTVEVVCGRMRRADVTRLRARRPGLLIPAGDRDVDYLVSTQSLEVGVDLDLPAMVTTLASAAALAQRAGRLNRSGRLEASTLVVVSPAGAASTEPDTLPAAFGPYAVEDIVAAAAWLAALEGSISPEAVTRSSLPLPGRPVLPALREVDLETLAMTSEPQAADPDVALYLNDPEREPAEVAVIARRHLELEAEVVAEALRTCPPRAHEIATIRLGKALEAVVQVARHGEVGSWVVRTSEGQPQAVPLEDALPLLPADTLVVPEGARICTRGVIGLGEHRGAAEALDDVLEEVADDVPFDAVIPLASADVASVVEPDPTLGSRASRNALAVVVEEARPDLAHLLRRHRRLNDVELAWCGGMAEKGLLVVRELRRRAEQAPQVAPDDVVTVDAHQAAVEGRLELILRALSAEELGADESSLRLAARLHDEGKRHPRFQRRMGSRDVALAKPRPGHVADRGDGWRHEQLSAAYAAAVSEGNTLAATLVAAHHGRGRLLFDRGSDDLLDGWDGCGEEVRAWVERLFGLGGSYEADRDREQRRLGVHRLALLEALLRCADIQVSREGG